MVHYIDKDALLAEIEKRISINEACYKISDGHEFYRGAIDDAKEIISFINTLEVIEVGLDLGDPLGDIEVKTIFGDRSIIVEKQKGK